MKALSKEQKELRQKLIDERVERITMKALWDKWEKAENNYADCFDSKYREEADEVYSVIEVMAYWYEKSANGRR